MKIFEVTHQINVQGIQQAAKLKAYNDAIAAGKSEAEAQNAEAAAGNLAGADALSKVDINNPATYINAPRPDTGPRSEAERQEWMKDPTATGQAAKPPAQTQPAAKQWQSGVLGVGSTGTEVSELQKKLGITADGKFGPATQQAVIALQKKLGVTPDGAYGPITKAAHDKMSGQGTQPPQDQPGYTTGATADMVDTKAAKGAANAAARSSTTTDPGQTSLNARVTTAIPDSPVNPANPGGASSKMTITPDQARAALDNGSERDINAFGGKERLQQLAGVTPTQPAPQPVAQPAPPRETGGGAVTSRPVQPATGARAQMLQRQQAQNQVPESRDTSFQKQLNAMKQIAGLR